MIEFLKRKVFTEVNKNAAILLYGTILSQAIPLIFSPILTRIYSPAEFGSFSLFFGIVAIAGNIGAGKMDLALYTAGTKLNATITAMTGIFFTIGFGVLSIVICLFLIFVGGIEKLSTSSIACIPLTIFALGCSNVLVALSNRDKKFKAISQAKISLGLVWVTTNIIAGLFHAGAIGLILGYCLGQVFSCWYLFYQNRESFDGIRYNFSTFKFNVIRNKNYALIFLPAHLLNTASASAPSFFLSYLYGLQSNGFFFKSARVGESPTMVIRSSLGNVFWQKASEDYLRTGNARKTLEQFLLKLIFIGLPSYGILYIIAPKLFVFVFGEPWFEAATYFRILVPYYFFQFIITPLTVMVVLANKPWIDITWQIGYATCIVSSFIYGWYQNNVLIGLLCYTISMSFMQIIALIINYKYSIKR